MTTVYLGLDELRAPVSLKADLRLQLHELERRTGLPCSVYTTIYYAPNGRRFTARCKLTTDGEEAMVSQGEDWDVERAILVALLSLSNQLHDRLYYLAWRDHHDAIAA